MSNFNAVILLLFILFTNCYAEQSNLVNVNDETQSRNNSCGAMALSQLLSGVGEEKISEQDVMESIRLFTGNEKDDYSIGELENSALKFGFIATSAKIPPHVLPNLKQPVVLLLGLNTQDFRHFVVLKGVVNGVAYIYDPIRRNIRLAYNDLIQKNITEKYPYFYVLGVKPKQQNRMESTIYLSDSEKKRNSSHYTEDQANAMILSVMSKKKQYIFDYMFSKYSGQQQLGLQTNRLTGYSNAINVRYGVTNDFQIGGGLQNVNGSVKSYLGNRMFTGSFLYNQYSVYLNKKISLTGVNSNSYIFGLSASYRDDNSIFGVGISAAAQNQVGSVQIIPSISLSKDISQNEIINSGLSMYQYSVSLGISKPIGDHYLTSMNLSFSNDKPKNAGIEPNSSYSISAGISYIPSRHFQISPSLSYSFGRANLASFGVNAAYIGNW